MKVIVLGGGVAGMSAAHELAERELRGGRVRDARDPRRQGEEHAGSRLGQARPWGPPCRARLPLLPRLLPAPAGHHEADPLRWPRRRGPRQSGSDQPGPACARGAAPRSSRRPTSRPLSTTWRRRSSRCSAGDGARDPRSRPGQLRQRSAPPDDQLRGAALRASTSIRAGGSSLGRRPARPRTANSWPTG